MQGSIDFSGILSGAITGEGGGGSVPIVTATATVDANIGTPEVSVTRTGSDENPNFNFGFKNLKGAKGDPGTNGLNGSDGSDGFSPAVTITDISNGHRVSITDETHPSGQIFDVMNGANGRDGSDGQNGSNGVSPVVTVTDITGGHAVTITDATHPLGQTFYVYDGQDGATGATGATGPAGPGLPAGGAMGQMIYKASNADYHTEWGDIPDASAITYDPTGRDYVTAVNVQGAIDELDGECASLSNSLTQLPDTMKYGTEDVIDLTQSTSYTATSAGIITGYFRKTSDTTNNGSVGATSNKASNAYVYISSIPSALNGGYTSISLFVVKGEKITFSTLTNINLGSSRISFRPLLMS